VSKKVIVKIHKGGFSRTVGSAYGFGSWTVAPTTFEMEVECDLETEEGREECLKMEKGLATVAYKAMERDIELACSKSIELKKSIEARETLVQNVLAKEQKDNG
jgi:hypothetical protein